MAPIPRQWYRNNAKNPRSRESCWLYPTADEYNFPGVRVMVHNILAACYASESVGLFSYRVAEGHTILISKCQKKKKRIQVTE